MRSKIEILFPINKYTQPRNSSYEGEHGKKRGNKRSILSHAKLFRIKSNKYNRFSSLSTLLFLVCWCCSQSVAQTWPWLISVSGSGSETISALTTRTNDGPVVCGHFQNELSIGNISETATGNTDAFVAGLDATGEVQWVRTGSSAGADKSEAVDTDFENNIYWAGEYWFNSVFGALTLSATKSAKAIFLLKLTPAGIPVWAKSIEGTGNKILSAMVTDQEGNSYLSGNFSDSLFIENEVMTAVAEKDFFIIKFSPSGNLLWARQAGIAGEIQPRRMACQNNQIAITGSMRGRYDFGTDTIQNNTNDSDAFLVVYAVNGNVRWARKIGGVNEQAGSDVAFDNHDNIYAVGSFYGLIRLRPDLEIQSPNLNDNLYFIKYDVAGFPLAARSIGNLEIELSESLVFANDRFYWSGFFKNNFVVDGFSLQAGGADFNTFILEIDTLSTVLNVHIVTSPSTVLLSELVADAEGQIYCGGALNGTAIFNDQTELTAANSFDGFVGQLTPLIVSVEAVAEASIKIYPNPATDFIRIERPSENLKITVFAMDGREILQTNQQTIDCREWPNGIYILKTNSGGVYLLMKK